jgi:hypothetical protein
LQFDARQVKRSNKRRKLSAEKKQESQRVKNEGGRKKTRPVRTFEQELTDTSKKALKTFRQR